MRETDSVFPAPAGINRRNLPPWDVVKRVPRASGDKPSQAFTALGLC
ncbi:hypothetical protein HUC42_02720 [Escherichia coli]|nr:hypothetical protein [Escherichia coli]NUD78846.1 hypothetical protein [Escherichia coli]